MRTKARALTVAKKWIETIPYQVALNYLWIGINQFERVRHLALMVTFCEQSQKKTVS